MIMLYTFFQNLSSIYFWNLPFHFACRGREWEISERELIKHFSYNICTLNHKLWARPVTIHFWKLLYRHLCLNTNQHNCVVSIVWHNWRFFFLTQIIKKNNCQNHFNDIYGSNAHSLVCFKLIYNNNSMYPHIQLLSNYAPQNKQSYNTEPKIHLLLTWLAPAPMLVALN